MRREEKKPVKRSISIILAFVLILSALFSVTATAADNISVYVDNKLVTLTDVNGNTVRPFIQNGTTYIPVRGVSQALGCIVEWDGDNRNVLIYKKIDPDGMKFRNQTDDVKLYVDNQEQILYDANGTEVKPFIKDGTTYVPLRGVSKSLGYYVEWEGSTRSVYVWKDEVSPNGVPLDFLRPYEIDAPIGGMDVLYESDGTVKEIGGTDYTDTIWGIFGSALFNLDGKYDTLTCDLGYVPESTSEGESTITFIVDSKIVESFNVTQNSSTKKIEVNLDKGSQLKISFNPGKNRADIYAGLGNITFYGE
ncbi:MAG: copper amine oxidase N-terminal domain-containing protein [Ruminococcaceae bacterium]|nr:copper amine oxidase N-terminal domain-containing protein [Oscillospiraceae bacterium]